MKFVRDIRPNTNIKRKRIGAMIDSNGNMKTERQDIADVFADFYAELFASQGAAAEQRAAASAEHVPAIEADEVLMHLRRMASKKAADGRGVVAELLKEAGGTLEGIIAEVFTDIVQPGGLVPDYWKQTRLKIIFKKGDPPDKRRITDPSLCYRYCTSYSAVLYVRGYGFSWMKLSRMTKLAFGKAFVATITYL